MRVLTVLPRTQQQAGGGADPLLLPLNKMLDESSDFYLSDSSSTTSSSTTVHTNNNNNASGDEPDNNNQLYSLIALHPSSISSSSSSSQNPLVSTTNSLTLIGGMNHLPDGSSNCNGSNNSNPVNGVHAETSDYNVVSGARLSSVCKNDVSSSNNLCGGNNAIITVDISSLSGGPGTCDMLVDTGIPSNCGSGGGGSLSDDSTAQSVSTTGLVNGDAEAVKKKNPVGRRKLILSAREKTLRRLESNERERLRMHSLNQAFQVC